ncbi:uncharacterized protein B0T23DRAFT_395721 [Neurospora hispaniola]|uniref:DNA/RNA-binding protein Alba-like domain-containing protein n=1 Tax=Neurospora hispaniola TaxID=588809 RepID=A0AAJ0MR73_9PEZI|nr:hypothetical protein B0T23DRAFT_395721 [Neurospora hispaniola]
MHLSLLSTSADVVAEVKGALRTHNSDFEIPHDPTESRPYETARFLSISPKWIHKIIDASMDPTSNSTSNSRLPKHWNSMAAAGDTMLHQASSSSPPRSASSSVSANQNKRRHFGEGDTQGNSSKKQRTTANSNIQQTASLQSNHPHQSNTTAGAVTPAFQPYESLLAKLRPRYEVKTMSVMPSTSIAKHVDKALQHLDRFSLWDQSVLPGVVLLSAKPVASSKLVTIAELVRRRIGEGEQKWFQYNVLAETEEEDAGGTEVVEDTVMDMTKDGDHHDEEEAFEMMGIHNNRNQRQQQYVGGGGEGRASHDQQPTVFERAIEPPKTRHNKYVSVFLSRIPIEELRTMRNVVVQSNEHHIEHLKKKRVGLVA